MKNFIRTVEWLSYLCGIVAAIMLVVAVAVVCQMVWVRYVLQASSYWQTEFVTYVLIASTFIGSPYVLMTRGHVNVELLPMYLKSRPRYWLALGAYSIAFLFTLLITWLGFEFWWEALEKEWLSETMWEVRLFIPYAAMPIGFGVLSLQYLVDIMKLVRGEDTPFGLGEGA